MNKTMAKLAAAGALIGFLGVGGMQLADAQEDPTTSTTVDESTDDATTGTEATTEGSATDDSATDDADRDGKNCHHDDEAAGDTNSAS
jgi:hypothetical protein